MEQNPLKKVMIVLIVVAVALAGALAYVWYQQSTLVKELTLDKENLTQEMIALQNDYASLSSYLSSYSEPFLIYAVCYAPCCYCS